MEKTKVKIWAGFYAEPVSVKDSDIYNFREVSELDISDELKEAIRAWDDEYQATFDSEYPPDSCFASPDLEAAHIVKGAELAERLQMELGEEYVVEYKP